MHCTDTEDVLGCSERTHHLVGKPCPQALAMMQRNATVAALAQETLSLIQSCISNKKILLQGMDFVSIKVFVGT